MTFDWGEFAALAAWLTSNPTTAGSREARLRSAISRAYYSAHCSVRNRMEAHKVWRRGATGRDHRELIDFLKKHGNGPRGKIGLDLDRLWKYRLEADYQDTIFGDLLKKAQLAVGYAQSIQSRLPAA